MRLDARVLLEEVLPALLRASSLPGPKAETIVQLVVADRIGLEYFYRIEGARVEAFAGISDRVDLTLAFISRDLASLLENKLDVRRAVRTSRIRVFGDEEVLAWLSQRLAA